MDSFDVENEVLSETRNEMDVKIKIEPQSDTYEGTEEIANIKIEYTCSKLEFDIEEHETEVMVRNGTNKVLHIAEEARSDNMIKVEDKSNGLHLIKNGMTTSELKVPNYPTAHSVTMLAKTSSSNINGEKTINIISPMQDVQKRHFKCDLCKRSYEHKKYLVKHLQIHFGIRFGCEVCGKSFTQKGALKTHLRRHGGNQFFCDMCGKSFSETKNLYVHMRRHTGGRFSCEVCGKPYPIEKDLVKHMENHKYDSL